MLTWAIIGSVATALLAAFFIHKAWGDRDHISPEALTDLLDDSDLIQDKLAKLPIQTAARNISTAETPLTATAAQYGTYRAVVVLLENRLTWTTSTMANINTETKSIDYDKIRDLSRGRDVGGKLQIHLETQTLTFSHIPLSQFDSLVELLEHKIESS